MHTMSADRFRLRRATHHQAPDQLASRPAPPSLWRRYPSRRRCKTQQHDNAHGHHAYPCGVHNVPVVDQSLSFRKEK